VDIKKKYNVLSLFSGAMGLDIGLDSTNRFNIVACLEKEPSFCETIRLNKKAGRLDKNLRIFEGDINDIDPSDVLNEIGFKRGEIDVVVGGPPCQAFSTAGRRKSTQDPRGTLLWRFLKYIEVISPRFFLMENVRGLTSAALKHRPIKDRPNKGGAPLSPDEEPGSVIKLFSEELQKISGAKYHMDCFEVNSVNYGAPQIRERVLFIGNRYEAIVDFPDPTHGPKTDVQSKNLSFPGFESEKKKPWATLRDAIGDLREEHPIVLDFSPRKKSFLSMVAEGSNWRSLPIEIQKESMGRAFFAKGGRSGWWRRLTFDLPCPTLITMPNHASTSLCHPTENRALSLKEYACIQEFPFDWEFSGKVSKRYAQIGNAVPVRLGEIAGDVIAQELDKLRGRNWKTYKARNEGYRIIYIQSHVRTRRWFKEGKTYLWKDGGENGNAKYAPSKTKRRETSI
jgi:DNA (cytosine-5)-methyltransferase 1